MNNNEKIANSVLEKEIAEQNFIKVMGLKRELVVEGKVVMSMVVKKNTTNIYGMAHGGALAGLIDTCMGLTCFTLGKKVVTQDMHINYIKAAKMGEKITATSSVLHAGKNTVMVEAVALNEAQEIVCQGTANFFVIGEAKILL